MKKLSIYDQPEAIENGEAYVRITAETVGELLLDTYNPDHPEPISDQHALKLSRHDARPMLHQWLSIGLCRFVPYTHVEIINGEEQTRYTIKEIKVQRPTFPSDAVRPDIECFVIVFGSQSF